jgi:hypothetical protein
MQAKTGLTHVPRVGQPASIREGDVLYILIELEAST